MKPIRGWGRLQDTADGLDPKLLAALVDEGLQDLMQRSSSAWAKTQWAASGFRWALRISRAKSLMHRRDVNGRPSRRMPCPMLQRLANGRSHGPQATVQDSFRLNFPELEPPREPGRVMLRCMAPLRNPPKIIGCPNWSGIVSAAAFHVLHRAIRCFHDLNTRKRTDVAAQ